MLPTAALAPLIGRESELAMLRAACADARSGRPRVIVVRGEAGIGKSRLLLEFLSEAVAHPDPSRDFVVATGQCVELGDIGAPFTAVRHVLWDLYLGVGDADFRSACRTDTVAATLGTLLPELADPQSLPQAVGPGPITEALERVIETLSTDRQLFLVIEDLHWADPATVALLKTLSATLRGRHVTLVMSYRSDDVGRDHPLRPMLTDLQRNRSVTFIDVPRLDPKDTAALAEAIGARLDSTQLAELAARSDGVPFFVEELVALGDSELPDTLRELVIARVERLSEVAREIVGMVAVGGVHVDHAALEAVFDGDRRRLTSGLREALAAHVLVTTGDGYAFRHALIHEAVRADLLPSERAELHRRFAEVLDARVAAGDTRLAAATAEHWLAAREVAAAFAATLIARQHARDTFATVTAAQLGERLLDLWPDGAEDHAGVSRVHLAIELCSAWRALSDIPRMLRTARIALGYRPAPTDRATLHAQAAIALATMSRHSDAIDEISAGLEALEGRDDRDALIVRSRLQAIASTLPDTVVGGAAERARLARVAIAAAEHAGDAAALVSILLHSCFAAADHGEYELALRTTERVLSLTPTPEQMLTAVILQAATLVNLGRFAEAIVVGRRSLGDAAEVGLERGMGSMIAANLGEALLAAGHSVEARTVLDRAISLLGDSPQFQSFALRVRATAAVWDGDDTAVDVVIGEHAPGLSEVRSEDVEEDLGWAALTAEALLNRIERTRGARERSALVGEALRLMRPLTSPDLTGSAGVTRRALPAAARAWVAAVTGAGAVADPPADADADAAAAEPSDSSTPTAARGNAETPAATATGRAGRVAELRAVIDRVVGELPDDAPSTAYRALIAAECARASATGTSSTDTSSTDTSGSAGTSSAARPTGAQLAAWRAAADVLADGALPVRYRDYAEYRLIESLLATGDPDLRAEAVERGAQLPDEAQAHGDAVIAVWTRSLLARHGLVVSRAETRQASPAAALTPRERQVLALVAEGLTNPQIGRRLFISPKTASVHVSAILAKIGATNRAEAAAFYAALRASQAGSRTS